MLAPHWPVPEADRLRTDLAIDARGTNRLAQIMFGIDLGMVRPSGFEPPRYCYRQPLKLVRLPVPPRPRFRTYLV